MSSTIRYLMTTPVVTVRPGTSFKGTVAAVRAAHVGTVPVIDDAGLVTGVVSAADLLATKASAGRRGPPSLPRHGLAGLLAWLRHGGRGRAAVTAAAVMRSPAVTICGDATSNQAARLMDRYRLGSLPVVDAAGRLIGILSQGDVLDTFTRSDTAIRHEVVQDLIWHDFLLDPDIFTVTVKNGVVTLTGRPESDLVGQSLAEAVGEVEGVVAVRDRLSYTTRRARRGAGQR